MEQNKTRISPKLQFRIEDRMIGPGCPSFIIAEAGVNHNGDIERALALVDAAADAGADAVKFQSFNADRLVTREAPKAKYQIANTGTSESQHQMLRALELSEDDHSVLQARCKERGVIFLSTPFDEVSADLLESLNVSAYKTPSGEITNLAYLAHVAKFGKPMIVSTGMANLGEVDAALATILAHGCSEIAILHCVSNYPASPADVNLRAMDTMSRAFRVPIGYSDHTLGLAISIASVALGATVLEKHITIDRNLPGPDHLASIEPAELISLVKDIRAVESSLGDGRKAPAESEYDTAAIARKSLVSKSDIAAGTVLTERELIALRPGTGISPALLRTVVGRTARVAIPGGTVLGWEMLG